ncbi:uncharacterized protein [Nicotiana sylvestris]|uniref:uncharacterized protein n=1 Tax=Nicotiana sylvestris TaxID=4096 RepID=UPI00388CE84B
MEGVVFIDDVLVYSRIQEKHARHLRIALQTLMEKKLFAKFFKCEFWLGSVVLLGHVMSSEGIKVDPKMIEAIQSWPRPSSATEIQSFFGEPNIIADLWREVRVIAYTSCHLKSHEKNYPIHDLELAAIVHTLKIWKHYLYCLSCGDTVQHADAKEVSIGDNGVLRMQGQICVPNVDGLREFILEESHSSRYSIHPGAVKMYQGLRKHYWWRRMKKDIVEFVARCLNC